MAPTEPYVIWNLTASQVIAIAAVVVGPIMAAAIALRVQHNQNDAFAEREKTARVHARTETTYVDVMDHAFRIRDYVLRTEPLVTFEGAPEPPAQLTDVEARRLSARISAFGSEEVLDKLMGALNEARHFSTEVDNLRLFRAAYADSRDQEEAQRVQRAFESIEPARKAVIEAIAELEDRVRTELAR